MPTQVQFRRGTTAQNAGFTGANGEISIDTSKKTAIVHDGSTPGGFPLAPNTAFDVANAAFNSANNVAPQVAPAFNTANAAFDKANNALANTSNVVFAGDLRVTGNVFVGTSTVTITNNSITASSITATNLVVNGSSVPSGAVSNLAFDTANAAFDKANAANVLAYNTGIGANAYADVSTTAANNYAGVMANSSNSYTVTVGISGNVYTNVSATAANNYAGVMANSVNAYTSATYSTLTQFGSIFGVSNAAFDVANAAYGQANTLKTSANAYADLVGTSANNYAGYMANSANSYAASLTPDLSPPFNVANAAFDKANAANVLAYNTGIGANAYATVVGTSSNNYAGVMANSVNTYTSATYYSKSGGTISGAVTINGDLIVQGNSYQYSSNTLVISDPLLYLAANNYTSDSIDIGFVANYVNATSQNVHTGIFRDSGTKEWYVFQGYDKEPEDNYIDPAGNNFAVAVLNADLRTSNLNLGGANAITWITSSYDKANSANVLAYNTGIGANAFATAVGTAGNAYAVTVGTSGNAFATAVGTAGNAYAVTVGTSGNNYAATVGTSSNNYAGVMANSVNAYTSATYSTLTQFGSVFGVANGAFGAANDKVASVTGTAGQIYSSGGTTPTVNLISTGVTATTYGGATQIPVIVVDAFGRLTSASNAAVQGMDYAYANTIWGVANGKVETVTSNSTSRIWANTVTVGSTETVYVDLAISGVTATTYGGSTQIPVITVDAYGRLTSASNVAVSGMDYPYVNTSTQAANNYLGGLANTGYAAQSLTVTTLSDASGTISWDASTSRMATVTMSGTGRTVANPTNLKAGSYILIVKQDATGSRTITTWGSAFKWPAAAAPALSTTASTTDVFSFWCDGTNLYGTYIPDCR